MISKQSRELILMAVRLERGRALLDCVNSCYGSAEARHIFEEGAQAVNELEALFAKHVGLE